jgi:hypothetical protein
MVVHWSTLFEPEIFHMKPLLLSLLLTFIASTAWVQTKQNYVWKFGGTGAGLDFANCEPIVLTNGINNNHPYEGQSSISDEATGRLLLYTDGVNVYDSTNQIMQNGTFIGVIPTLTQTIIIRKPGSNTIFYVFTTEVQGGLSYNMLYPNARGINYAVVDMSLNAGLGAVTSKYTPLKSPVNSEKLTAVRHANGTDIWLITHEYGSNKFFTFLITSAGINFTPVVSATGPIILTPLSGTPSSSNFDAIGELKASTDGRKIAFTCLYSGTTCLANFDKTSGKISDPISLSLEAAGYGVSFSQDNMNIYVSGIDTAASNAAYATRGKIYQFDIISNDQITIQNSRTIIYTDAIGSFRSLKLGINGKIYVARVLSFTRSPLYLGVINNPNNKGLACNYIHDGIYLNGLEGRWGLNNAMEDATACGQSNMPIDSSVVLVYPNPFIGQIKVRVNRNYNSISLVLYNCVGQTIKKILNLPGPLTTVDCKNLSSGLYILRLMRGKEVLTTKPLIKAN